MTAPSPPLTQVTHSTVTPAWWGLITFLKYRCVCAPWGLPRGRKQANQVGGEGAEGALRGGEGQCPGFRVKAHYSVFGSAPLGRGGRYYSGRDFIPHIQMCECEPRLPLPGP